MTNPNTRAHISIGAYNKIAEDLIRTEARAKRLEEAIRLLMNRHWKSIDKDNMEFQITVSCYTRDKLLAALEPKS